MMEMAVTCLIGEFVSCTIVLCILVLLRSKNAYHKSRAQHMLAFMSANEAGQITMLRYGRYIYPKIRTGKNGRSENKLDHQQKIKRTL